MNTELEQAQRRRAILALGGAVTNLASAGTMVRLARGKLAGENQEMAAALAEDISRLLGDVEALQSVIQGR